MTHILILVLTMWIIIFAWQPLNFWFLMTLAQLILISITIYLRGIPLKITTRNLALGSISATILYGVFYLGNILIQYLPFLTDQVTELYSLGDQISATLAILLILIIGSGEEIFWRRLIQDHYSAKYSPVKALYLTTILYSSIHLVSGNPMLILAALTAGLFWGYLYLRYQDLTLNIISHVIWDLLIFLILPLY